MADRDRGRVRRHQPLRAARAARRGSLGVARRGVAPRRRRPISFPPACVVVNAGTAVTIDALDDERRLSRRPDPAGHAPDAAGARREHRGPQGAAGRVPARFPTTPRTRSTSGAIQAICGAIEQMRAADRLRSGAGRAAISPAAPRRKSRRTSTRRSRSWIISCSKACSRSPGSRSAELNSMRHAHARPPAAAREPRALRVHAARRGARRRGGAWPSRCSPTRSSSSRRSRWRRSGPRRSRRSPTSASNGGRFRRRPRAGARGPRAARARQAPDAAADRDEQRVLGLSAAGRESRGSRAARRRSRRRRASATCRSSTPARSAIAVSLGAFRDRGRRARRGSRKSSRRASTNAKVGPRQQVVAQTMLVVRDPQAPVVAKAARSRAARIRAATRRSATAKRRDDRPRDPPPHLRDAARRRTSSSRARCSSNTRSGSRSICASRASTASSRRCRAPTRRRSGACCWRARRARRSAASRCARSQRREGVLPRDVAELDARRAASAKSSGSTCSRRIAAAAGAAGSPRR